jgi:hypothetical protein
MTVLMSVLDAVLTNSQATLYFVQAATYALAFWAVRRGKHAPSQVYLASCIVHATLGLLHTLSLG